jgi:hypothetical protein
MKLSSSLGHDGKLSVFPVFSAISFFVSSNVPMMTEFVFSSFRFSSAPETSLIYLTNSSAAYWSVGADFLFTLIEASAFPSFAIMKSAEHKG